jgi:hypothetical protein
MEGAEQTLSTLCDWRIFSCSSVQPARLADGLGPEVSDMIMRRIAVCIMFRPRFHPQSVKSMLTPALPVSTPFVLLWTVSAPIFQQGDTTKEGIRMA